MPLRAGTENTALVVALGAAAWLAAGAIAEGEPGRLTARLSLGRWTTPADIATAAEALARAAVPGLSH